MEIENDESESLSRKNIRSRFWRLSWRIGIRRPEIEYRDGEGEGGDKVVQ
jgi:hypothetical protein